MSQCRYRGILKGESEEAEAEVRQTEWTRWVVIAQLELV